MNIVAQPRYTSLSVLGQGGQSKVFLAQDRNSGKLVAIKQALQKKTLDQEYTVLTYLEQYGAPTGISHLLDTIPSQEEEVGLVLEYIAGRTMQEIPKHSVSLQLVLKWIDELFTILAQLHDRGVVHRDLSPRNIIVDPNGSLHVIDFGLSRISRIVTTTTTPPPLNPFRCDVADMICLAAGWLHQLVDENTPAKHACFHWLDNYLERLFEDESVGQAENAITFLHTWQQQVQHIFLSSNTLTTPSYPALLELVLEGSEAR